jgi:hypothetical protein
VGHFTDLQAAAIEAQTELAEMQGMAAGGSNVLYRGAEFVGVWGQPQATEAMNPAGGYRRRHEITLTATRAQFDAPPDTKEQIVRTDIAPPVTYRIDVVDTTDVLHYVFRCIKVGE